VTTALGVVEAAADLLRRLVWVLPIGPDYDVVERVRGRVSLQIGALRASRDGTGDMWNTDPILAGLMPNKTYWKLRLASYERLMIGAEQQATLEELITRVVTKEGERVDADTRGNREKAVLRALQRQLLAPDRPPGSEGENVRGLVDNALTQLQDALPVLDKYCEHNAGTPGAGEDVKELTRWRDLLIPRGNPLVRDELLARLLQLEIAATTLGDEVQTENMLPVELAQLSAQTNNPFSRYTRTADDKLGGMAVNRFGGFFKRSCVGRPLS
jgi:hypothetical protein